MNLKKLISDIKNIRFPIAIIIMYVIITNFLFKTVCPSIILLGHECPACGLTRACLSLLTLQFKKSFEYNPSATMWIGLIVVSFISRYVKKIPDLIIYIMMIITGLSTIIMFYLF